MSRIVTIPIEPHFAGEYRLEYDGKYVTLFGRDRNYPQWGFGLDAEGQNDKGAIQYEEMVLVPCVVEVRDAEPRIVGVDNQTITIDLGV